MKDRLALWITVISSPYIVLFVVPFFLIARFSDSVQQSVRWGALWSLLAIIGPLLFIYVQIHRNVISDIHVQHREQRIVPLTVAVCAMAILTLVFSAMNAPTALMAMAVNVLINGVIFLAITLCWKISIHAASLSGSIVTVAILIDHRLLWLMLLLPLVVWARIQRKRHDLWQGIVAIVLVSLTTYLTFHYFGLV